MFLRLENIHEKKLIGQRKKMSFAQNKTKELWQSFMPIKKEIKNTLNSNLYSLEVYNNVSYFTNFDPKLEFYKWAAVEVTDLNTIPKEMESLIIPPGLYAVFLHKGKASEGSKTYQFIFATWLPNSAYVIDNRPHFAVMGEKYKNESNDSEEEIWIPIKTK